MSDLVPVSLSTDEGNLGQSSSGLLDEETAIDTNSLGYTGTLFVSSTLDVEITNLSVLYFNVNLLKTSTLELKCGKRYGLIGKNGCGKSALMTALSSDKLPIANFFSVQLVQAVPKSDKTVIASIMDGLKEEKYLNRKRTHEGVACSKTVVAARAVGLLQELGLNKSMILREEIKDFSYAWRMRIGIVRALCLKPHFLLLDEPTKYLDMRACKRLELELKKFEGILVLTSHAQDFLKAVCTDIIHMTDQRLFCHDIDYETFVARRSIPNDQLFYFFEPSSELENPTIMLDNVRFRYNNNDSWIFKDLDININLNGTRLALIGDHDAGKSTFLKLLHGCVTPTSGKVIKSTEFRISHFSDKIQKFNNLDITPSDFFHMRHGMSGIAQQFFERFFLKPHQRLRPMRQLTAGVCARVVLADLSMQAPHLLLLDGPTKYLDTDGVIALGNAINEFKGSVIVVSNDTRFIKQINAEVWICGNETVRGEGVC